VERQLAEAVATLKDGDEAEIAFFGGSFTGIDRGLMIRLLQMAQPYLVSGKVSSLRCSTRPDYINGEILDILARYGVRTVELGIQSTSDEVLAASKRGHTAEVAWRAAAAIKSAGFNFIGQMMIGLPASNIEREIATARDICAMGADGARVYPTVVFADTELSDMSASGEYEPLIEEDAVRRTAAVLEVFDTMRVPVIRVGLHSGESLSSPEKAAAYVARLPPFECPHRIYLPLVDEMILSVYSAAAVCAGTGVAYAILKFSFQPAMLLSVPRNTIT
jgi:histone acetyltransferase (RNA polymerase elongator complex component)